MLFFSTTERCCAYPSRLIIWQSTAVSLMPVMGILAVLTILFAFALARWQTNRLIKPINELDLERPLDSDIYEELSPLLEAMDRQNREKEAVANMRKEFSANVSHELKTPLTSISGYAEIMKNGLVRPGRYFRFFGTHLQRGAQTDHPDRRYY